MKIEARSDLFLHDSGADAPLGGFSLSLRVRMSESEMANERNWISVHEGADHTRIAVKAGDLSLIWSRALVFAVSAAALAWSLRTIYLVEEGPSGPRVLVALLLAIPALVGTLGALMQAVLIFIFYLRHSGTTRLEVSINGVSNSTISVPADGLPKIFISNKLREKYQRQPVEVLSSPNIMATRPFGWKLERQFADRAYSISVNLRGTEKHLVKGLNVHQAEYLFGQIQHALGKYLRGLGRDLKAAPHGKHCDAIGQMR